MSASKTPQTALAADPNFPPARGRLAEYLDESQPEVQHLLKHGWCVVRVLSEEEAAKYLKWVWADLAAMGTGIKMKDASTLTKGSYPGAPRGLMQAGGAGLCPSHCAAANAAEREMQRLFGAKGVQALLRAWDALGFMDPDKVKNYAKRCRDAHVKALSAWLHTDDAPPKYKGTDLLHWVQMIIALEPVEHGDIGTQVVGAPDNMNMQAFVDWFGEERPDQAPSEKKLKSAHQWQKVGWCDHDTGDKEWLAKHGVPAKPHLRPGEALMWTSRTPHANIAEDAGDKPRNWRTSVLTNYIPRAVAYDKEIAKRQEMGEKGRTSGHQVVARGAAFDKNGSLCEQLFGKAPNTYGPPHPGMWDHNKTPLPVMNGFARYKRPRSEWSDAERYPDPERHPKIYKIHADTARLCFGYDTAEA